MAVRIDFVSPGMSGSYLWLRNIIIGVRRLDVSPGQRSRTMSLVDVDPFVSL
jgi:hypothetical protein